MVAVQLLDDSVNSSPQAVFLAILPKLQKHAEIQSRSIICADRRADTVAEAVALAWKWHLRLLERGKDVRQFPMVFIYLVVAAVKSGRRLAGMEKSKDAMSRRAQKRNSFRGEQLPQVSTLTGDPLADALTENTVTPPPDAAAFRIDFPRWLESLPERNRRVAKKLMIGEGTRHTAHRFGMSPARVSQLRRELSEDWVRFHGDAVTAAI